MSPWLLPEPSTTPRALGSPLCAHPSTELKMMSSSKSLLLAALMSLLLFHLCSQSEAASAFDCCLQYREQNIPTRAIKSFTRQLANEACDIDAVIFHTKKGYAVCADPKRKWVRHALHVLSLRTKKI